MSRNKQPIKIVQATISDIDQLVPLFDAYRVFYRKESDLSRAKSFLTERIQNQESAVLIAYDGAEAIGFTQLYPLFSSTRMVRTFLLNDLFVSPEYRGQGCSKLLIQAAKDYTVAHNGASLMLETEKSNVVGNNLYPSVGFTLDQDHNYYSWDV